jgi:hypothetical protein
LWYKPWGESRGTPFGTTPTPRRFTGQVLDSVAGGLYFYNWMLATHSTRHTLVHIPKIGAN